MAQAHESSEYETFQNHLEEQREQGDLGEKRVESASVAQGALVQELTSTNSSSSPASPAESTPDNSSCNSVLDPAHLTEWLNSAVDYELIHLNVKSLSSTTAYDYLLYSSNISRRNDGRLRDRDLNKYRHIEHGGWWCSGVDPLNDYQLMLWGCFKPNSPRRDFKKIHKLIKYEHPYREETRAFFLYVPDAIWAKVSARCGIRVTEEDSLGTSKK